MNNRTVIVIHLGFVYQQCALSLVSSRSHDILQFPIFTYTKCTLFTIASNFYLALQSSQEKSKSFVMQNLGGGGGGGEQSALSFMLI